MHNCGEIHTSGESSSRKHTDVRAMAIRRIVYLEFLPLYNLFMIL